MRKLILISFLLMSCALLVNCANKIEAKVPNHITTTTNVTGSVDVHYIIGLDLNVQDMFRKDCTSQLGPNATQAQIDSCVAGHVTTIIDALTAALAKQPVPTATPAPAAWAP